MHCIDKVFSRYLRGKFCAKDCIGKVYAKLSSLCWDGMGIICAKRCMG